MPETLFEGASIVRTDAALVGSVPAIHSCQLLMPSPFGSLKSAEPSVARPSDLFLPLMLRLCERFAPLREA